MAVGPDVSMIAEAGNGSGTTGSASGRLPDKGSGTTGSASGKLPELAVTGRAATFKGWGATINVAHVTGKCCAGHDSVMRPGSSM